MSVIGDCSSDNEMFHGQGCSGDILTDSENDSNDEQAKNLDGNISDESNDDDVEYCWVENSHEEASYECTIDKDELFLPLYPGANISICGAYCAIMSLQSKCSLPFTTVSEILELLQLLCPANNKLPSSVYHLRKFFSRFQSLKEKTEYCPYCQEKYVGRSCSNVQCSYTVSEPDVFIQMDVEKQIRTIFNRKCIHS